MPLGHDSARLYDILRSGKLCVRVLPDDAFGLIHGKAGVITLYTVVQSLGFESGAIRPQI